MSEVDAAIQTRLNHLIEDKNQIAMRFNKHRAVTDFCGIASITNVLAGFVVAAGGMWVAATVLVAIGLALRFAEVFHGRVADRAQEDMTIINQAIINVRRDYRERY
jgi:hypothetical protein